MLERLFRSRKKTEAAASPTASPPVIDEATVGLCFNYERGLRFESEYLSDLGVEHIMKVLKRLNLRGTFFCPAKLCETSPDHIARIAREGHELAVLGYYDEDPRELTEDAIKQLVYACRNAFGRRGYHPVGFRAPGSHWDARLCAELARQNFLYNAEHDHAKQLYYVPGPPPILRVPIRTDDRGLRRSEDTYDATVSKHLRSLRKALAGKYFVSICFHPWILAEDMQRMEHWEQWIGAAVRGGARVLPLEAVIPKDKAAAPEA